MPSTGKITIHKKTLQSVWSTTLEHMQGNRDNVRQRTPVPKLVETSQEGRVAVFCNQQMQTDRTIPNKKPDIIIRDNEKGPCMVIDVAISGYRNVIKKTAEKILKHKDPTAEIQGMWNVKTNVIPVIIGATGTISK